MFFPRSRSWQSLTLGLTVAICLTTAFAAEHEFRYTAPDAKSVDLMCEFNGWKAIPMTKGADGVWTAKVSLSAGTHAYKFLVNGTDWVFDPNNSARTKVDGIENSAAEVSNADGTIVPASAQSPTAAVRTPTSTSLTTVPVATASVSPARAEIAPTPGEILELEVPLSDKRRTEAAREKHPKLAHARMALAVPPGFDPQKSWPILVICNTEAYSNIDSMRQFKQAAVDEGWMIVAADAVESEKNQEGSPRWPCAAAAFDYLTTMWPKIQSWPIACGGMSGGAKNSAFLAADFARENHHVIGMLMMGCNQDMATVAYRKGGAATLLNAAIFLSSGKSDTIATPAHHEYVKKSLQGTGFRKVRLESFDGAHDIYPPHITEALKWFVAQSTGAAPKPSPSSDFDKFFKKKP